MKEKLKSPLFIKIAALTLAIILSVFVLSPVLSNPQFHKKSIEIIDNKKLNATTIASAVTIVSTAISAIPDDTATPLANELSDLSSPLFLVVCILFFEKFLLTTLECLSFSILLPIAFLCFILYVLKQRRSLYIFGVKLALIALLCATIIPLGIHVTGMIDDVHQQSINSIMEEVSSLETAFTPDETEKNNGLMDFVSGLKNGITEITSLAKNILSLLIDAVAVIVVTSILMPIITLFAFVWCFKLIISGRMENLYDSVSSFVTKYIPKKQRP